MRPAVIDPRSAWMLVGTRPAVIDLISTWRRTLRQWRTCRSDHDQVIGPSSAWMLPRRRHVLLAAIIICRTTVAAPQPWRLFSGR
jgi:hypothetical protein